jgi:hypothetical protein
MPVSFGHFLSDDVVKAAVLFIRRANGLPGWPYQGPFLVDIILLPFADLSSPWSQIGSTSKDPCQPEMTRKIGSA